LVLCENESGGAVWNFVTPLPPPSLIITHLSPCGTRIGKLCSVGERAVGRWWERMCHLSIFGWEHSGKGLVAFSSHTLSLSLSALCVSRTHVSASTPWPAMRSSVRSCQSAPSTCQHRTRTRQADSQRENIRQGASSDKRGSAPMPPPLFSLSRQKRRRPQW